MRMEFIVVYDDGREEKVVTKPKDIVAFERQYGVSMPDIFGEGKPVPPMEYLYYLAWSPLHRAGTEPRAFDEFLDHVDEVTGVEDAKAVDPTQPEVSDAPLPD